jgi:hypothetical protein
MVSEVPLRSQELGNADTIFEENPPEEFKGIDIMRAVRSSDPCLPCGVRSAGDPATAATADEVVRLVVELDGAGLERTLALPGLDPVGQACHRAGRRGGRRPPEGRVP